ncbi:MAG: ABC transporter ATP-binding protein [Planctomycetes bacterium]|nr:ABC transporter ATP-binding protein [Planctomycetota bacterium]
MAKTTARVLDHIFSYGDLFRRKCWLVWFWSKLSVFLLVLLLLVAGLFVGMLSDRGRLTIDIPRAEIARFTTLTDLPAGVQSAPAQNPAQRAEPAAEPAPPVDAAVPETVHVSFAEHGILPAVWRSRDAWWGGYLAWLYRHVDLLQSNILASITLLMTGALLVASRALCLSQLRRQTEEVALLAVAPSRRNVHRQALRLGPEDLDGSSLQAARDLYIHDIETVRQNLVRWIEFDVRFVLELICLAIIAVSIQPMLSAQYLLLMGIAWYYLEGQDRRTEAERHLAADRVALELKRQSDRFQSARLIRGLGIEQADHDHFAADLLKLHDLTRKWERAANNAQHRLARDVVASVAIGAFLLFQLANHILLVNGELSIVGGAVFLATWILAVPGIRALRSRTAVLHSANVSAEKIQKFLDQIPTVSQAVGARFLQPMGSSLYFESVSYKSPAGRMLLNELDLKLEAGRSYALVSLDPLESNALVSMLPRFIEPQKGRILFDGEDIAWATLESLRAETVYVGADEPLLPGTVLDNIRGGRAEYTLQQATDAAKMTHAHNFIVKLFDGYESVLPERADLMDVSQRFRLGLARAMIRNPALLIIEEPQVALDEDTKSLLADAYDRICRGRTVLFLPRRLSTVKRCDHVVLINDGRVAAIGPQSKLVNASPIYKHWEYLNFNREFRHHDHS